MRFSVVVVFANVKAPPRLVRVVIWLLPSGQTLASLKIARLVDIEDERSLCRTPSQLPLRLRTRSRTVERREMREPAKMIGCLFLRLADDRYF
jgi:hypothetical protein